MHVYIYIYTYECTHMNVYAYVHLCICIYMYIHIHINIPYRCMDLLESDAPGGWLGPLAGRSSRRWHGPPWHFFPGARNPTVDGRNFACLYIDIIYQKYRKSGNLVQIYIYVYGVMQIFVINNRGPSI